MLYVNCQVRILITYLSTYAQTIRRTGRGLEGCSPQGPENSGNTAEQKLSAAMKDKNMDQVAVAHAMFEAASKKMKDANETL